MESKKIGLNSGKLRHGQVRGWSKFLGFSHNSLKLRHNNKLLNIVLLMWLTYAN